MYKKIYEVSECWFIITMIEFLILLLSGFRSQLSSRVVGFGIFSSGMSQALKLSLDSKILVMYSTSARLLDLILN